MKKETTNTFLKGMIKDLHPLTTPNDVLTDALNGTLITYNGNEGALLNDMGNVKIKNALLKAGYVPVGMKEHGGIIYVAAYNPTTKKGQVGSFPSPKQLWEGENWDINKPANILTTVTIPSTMYNDNFIIRENVKLALFTTSNGEARIFHPGDKYIIGFPNKKAIEPYIKGGTVNGVTIPKGCMSIQLGVVKSDGSIEIMKTWSEDTDGDFLYEGSETSLSGYFSDVTNVDKVQVFDASSSGEIILIIKLNTLDSFNLLREYSMTNNKIKVTFTGEATKDNVTYSSENDSYLKLATGNSDYDHTRIEVVEGNTIPSMIYPNVPFGIIQRMGRAINIDFDKIRRNQDDFGEWRFFVTDTYVKIGWAYDFYNLDGSKKIEYIRMYFHKLEDGYDRKKAKQVDFQRESYNGNFEDHINYADIGLQYRRIYIVEIVKKLTGESEQIIDFKMLYLSKLYNSSYNGFYTNNTIGLAGENNSSIDRLGLLYECIPPLSISIKLNHSLDTELISSNSEITCPDNTKYNVPTLDIKPKMFTTQTSDLDMSLTENYYYLTNVTNEYNSKFKIIGELLDIENKYIGKPKDNIILALLGTYSISSITIERGDKKWVKSSSLKNFPGTIEEPDHGEDYTVNNTNMEYTSDTPSVTDNTFTIDNIKFKDNRFIQGLISDIKSKTYQSKGLKPLYAPDYASDRKNRIAPYWNFEGDTLCMSGAGDGDNQTIHYNSKILPSGTIIEGPDAGGGCDDGGLITANNYMGRPMTNIFSGNHGEDAEIEFDALYENESLTERGYKVGASEEMNFLSSHGEDGRFLDYLDDDYLIACWKFTDGNVRFVNLTTPRAIPAKSTLRWPRLDVMLRCILSQIFIVNNVTKKTEYVTTNDRYYLYLEGTTKIKITLALNSSGLSNILENVMVSEDDNIALSTHFANKWKNGNFSISEGSLVAGSTYHINNLIPTINVSNPNISKPIEIEIPNLYDLDVLLGYYLGTTFNENESNLSDLDLKAIYAIDVNEKTFNASVCHKLSEEKPIANIDGTYEWTDTPKYYKLDSEHTSLFIYRWNDSDILIEFPQFFNCFTTKAAELEWDEIPENEENEVLAKLSNSRTSGIWTDAADENAPDMYYTTLYSPTISVLRNYT